MIGLLSPLFLVGGAAALVPVVLHLLRRNPEQRVRFAPVAFLKGAPVEQVSRRRLREWLLLTLRVSVCVLLALAFARPFFRGVGAAQPAGTTVVALDTSYSMSAPGRFERARAMASEAVRTAPAGDEVAVVTFSDQADVLVRSSADRGGAIAAIDAANAGFGSTRYRAALDRAGSLIATGRGTIVVVTDLQENGWDGGDALARVPEGTRLVIRDVGALPANLAVTNLRIDGTRAIATVYNSGDRSQHVRAHASVNGNAAGETMIAVNAHESAEAVFLNIGGSGAMSVSIDDRDGLQADNSRYALLSDASLRRVFVGTATGNLDRDAFYVRHALAAGRSGNDRIDAAGTSVAQLSTLVAPSFSSASRSSSAPNVVILLSTKGLEPRGRAALASFVAGGGGLLIGAGPEVDGDVVADVLGPGVRLAVEAGNAERETAMALAPADIRHPIFRAFGPEAASLGLVSFRRAARIGGPGCQVLAKFSTGDPAVLDCAAGDGRAVLVASDLNGRWNDFPVHASFVPFLHEAVRYLSASSAEPLEYLVGDLPDGVKPQPGTVVLGVDRKSTRRTRTVAVNVDTRESDPARMSPEEFQAAVTTLKNVAASDVRRGVREQESRQHVWQYLLGAMALTLVVEGAVARRAA